jgi:hypothetical protein
MSLKSFRSNPPCRRSVHDRYERPAAAAACCCCCRLRRTPLRRGRDDAPPGTKAGSTMPRNCSAVAPSLGLLTKPRRGLAGVGCCWSPRARVRGISSNPRCPTLRGLLRGVSAVVRVALRLGVCLLPSGLYGTAGITPWFCLFEPQRLHGPTGKTGPWVVDRHGEGRSDPRVESDWCQLIQTTPLFNFTAVFCGDGFSHHTHKTRKPTFSVIIITMADPYGLGATREGMLVSGIALISLWNLMEKRFRRKWARSIERIARDAT